MRRRRLLLATTALSTMTFLGCRESPLPGNPKGSVYDDAAALPPPTSTPKGSSDDAGAAPIAPATATATAIATAPPTTGPTAPVVRHLPANPKGSHYDAGLRPKPVKD